ncbi:hypothetical protein N9L68_04410 [bacterium]|nr:hypothetical protein [bacterium]
MVNDGKGGPGQSLGKFVLSHICVGRIARRRGRGQNRTRYYQTHEFKKVVALNMPTQCPEECPKRTEVRKARLCIEDRQQIWFELEDVELAARYLHIQNILKGGGRWFQRIRVALTPSLEPMAMETIGARGIRMRSDTHMYHCIPNSLLESMAIEMSWARVERTSLAAVEHETLAALRLRLRDAKSSAISSTPRQK